MFGTIGSNKRVQAPRRRSSFRGTSAPGEGSKHGSSKLRKGTRSKLARALSDKSKRNDRQLKANASKAEEKDFETNQSPQQQQEQQKQRLFVMSKELLKDIDLKKWQRAFRAETNTRSQNFVLDQIRQHLLAADNPSMTIRAVSVLLDMDLQPELVVSYFDGMKRRDSSSRKDENLRRYLANALAHFYEHNKIELRILDEYVVQTSIQQPFFICALSMSDRVVLVALSICERSGTHLDVMRGAMGKAECARDFQSLHRAYNLMPDLFNEDIARSLQLQIEFGNDEAGDGGLIRNSLDEEKDEVIDPQILFERPAPFEDMGGQSDSGGWDQYDPEDDLEAERYSDGDDCLPDEPAELEDSVVLIQRVLQEMLVSYIPNGEEVKESVVRDMIAYFREEDLGQGDDHLKRLLRGWLSAHNHGPMQMPAICHLSYNSLVKVKEAVTNMAKDHLRQMLIASLRLWLYCTQHAGFAEVKDARWNQSERFIAVVLCRCSRLPKREIVSLFNCLADDKGRELMTGGKIRRLEITWLKWRNELTKMDIGGRMRTELDFGKKNIDERKRVDLCRKEDKKFGCRDKSLYGIGRYYYTLVFSCYAFGLIDGRLDLSDISIRISSGLFDILVWPKGTVEDWRRSMMKDLQDFQRSANRLIDENKHADEDEEESRWAVVSEMVAEDNGGDMDVDSTNVSCGSANKYDIRVEEKAAAAAARQRRVPVQSGLMVGLSGGSMSAVSRHRKVEPPSSRLTSANLAKRYGVLSRDVIDVISENDEF